MPDKFPVYGFLGNAPTTAENIAANLDELPGDAIFIVPTKEHLEFGAPNLIPIITWLKANYDAGDTQESFSVLKTLQDHLSEGHDATLIMLWDPADEVDQATRTIAHEAGIPVLDLPHGMYELPAPDDPPWDTAEEKAHEFYKDPEHLTIAEPPAPPDLPAQEIVSPPQIVDALTVFIRNIVRKELKDMGLIPGVNKVPQAETGLDEDQRIIEAFGQPVAGSPAPDPVGLIDQITRAHPPMPADVQPTTKWVRGPDGVFVRRRPGRLAKGLEVVQLTDKDVEELRGYGKIRD